MFKGHSNELIGASKGECFKELFGGTFVKTTNHLHQVKSCERRSSIYKKNSTDKIRMIMPTRNRHNKNQIKDKALK